MPTYDDITNSETAAGDFLTQSLIRRLRDNPEAIADGDPTAPRVRVRGLDSDEDRADGDTGPASEGMVPVVDGSGNVAWDFAASKGGYIRTTSTGWVNLFPIQTGEKYKIDGTISVVYVNSYTFVISSTIAAFIASDGTGRVTRAGVVTDNSPSVSNDFESDNTGGSGALQMRVSGGFVQYNVAAPSGSLTSADLFVSFVRVSS